MSEVAGVGVLWHGGEVTTRTMSPMFALLAQGDE